MEFDEWQAVSKATVEECRRHGTPVMIGVTSTYTLGAQRRAACAAELGADAVQAALPFWMEMDDREVVPFFRAVADACPGLGMTIYETQRAKKTLTVEQHRAVFDATGSYLAVKANADTVGCTPDGCEQLSRFINVWVGENEIARLGPHGANGCASSLVYMNPRVVLHMFTLLQQEKWDELKGWTDKVDRLFHEGLDLRFAEKGFTDTVFDHMLGKVAGFLAMPVRSRGTYGSATDEDVAQLHAWMSSHLPELLVL